MWFSFVACIVTALFVVWLWLENKMHNKFQFSPTFILALIGALAWTPALISLLKPNRIVGKMISRYRNLNEDKSQTLFLFKLSILSKNKSFNLKQIKCEIENLNSEKFLALAANYRLIVFTQNNNLQKLLLSGEDFLNNSSFLPRDKNIVGYLVFKFDGSLDFKPLSTTFIFNSFEDKVRKLKIKESNVFEGQLFFDDTIWQTVDQKYIQNHPAVNAPIKQ